jgi:hypothetical protein
MRRKKMQNKEQVRAEAKIDAEKTLGKLYDLMFSLEEKDVKEG